MSQLQNTLNNVAILNTGVVFRHIQSFFISFSGISTGSEYERDVRLFFKEMKKKDIEHLLITDVKTDISEMNFYKDILVKSGNYKNTSINRMISSVISLYRYLKGIDEYEPLINAYMFNQIKKLPSDTKNIDVLYEEEAKLVAKLALNEMHKAEEKHALICLAIETSIRKDAVTKIRFCDIEKHKNREDLYVISSEELFDKTKMVNDKEISKSLYDKIIKLKINKKDNDFIFSISPTTIDTMIKRLCKKAEIDPTLKISFHSLKKTGVQYAYDTGGLRAAQIQAGHSSPTVTSNIYLAKETNIATSMFQETDNSIFDELSLDEFLILAKSFGNGIGTQLRNKAQEIVNNRE